MPCIPKPTPCQQIPIYQQPNNCKDLNLQKLILPTINGQRITLYCNECYVYDQEVETNVFCVTSSGFCYPPCRNTNSQEE